jgi:PEP-CTERM motif
MKKLALLFFALFVFSFVQPARANPTSCITTASGAISCTGILSSPEDFFTEQFTVSGAPTTVTLQTYGFGGGTNANGEIINPGGTDPFLAIFSGTGNSGTILTDGATPPNALATSLTLTNNVGFAGCGPANTVSWGGDKVCGDITMTLPSLAGGTYTVVLSDGQYPAQAAYDNGTLGEGFVDFTGGAGTPPTGGVFCNAVNNGVPCPNNSGAFALDIIGLPANPSPTPEPTSLLLFGSGLLVVSWRSRKRASRTVVMKNKS